MAGHKPWSEIRGKMSPERQARVDERVRQTLAEMPLHELRRARQLTQQQLADALGIEQGNISKLERRTDMYVSTLRKFIEALGGTLDITAQFPDGDVRIQQFREVTPPDRFGEAAMQGSHWTQDSPGYFPAAQTHEWLKKRLHEIEHGEIDEALRAILDDGWRQDKDLAGMPEAAKAKVAELVDTAYYALRRQPPDVATATSRLREALDAIYA